MLLPLLAVWALPYKILSLSGNSTSSFAVPAACLWAVFFHQKRFCNSRLAVRGSLCLILKFKYATSLLNRSSISPRGVYQLLIEVDVCGSKIFPCQLVKGKPSQSGCLCLTETKILSLLTDQTKSNRQM